MSDKKEFERNAIRLVCQNNRAGSPDTMSATRIRYSHKQRPGLSRYCPRDKKKNDMNGMICYPVIPRGFISKRSWILITTIRYRIRQGFPRPMQILAGAKP